VHTRRPWPRPTFFLAEPEVLAYLYATTVPHFLHVLALHPIMWSQSGLLQALRDAGRFSGAFGFFGRRLDSSLRPIKVLQCLHVWALQGIFFWQLEQILSMHLCLVGLSTLVVFKPIATESTAKAESLAAG